MHRILLADDDRNFGSVLKGELEKDDHEVRLVTDGVEAVLNFIDDNYRYDFVLLDIKMPRLDGLEATRQIMARRPVPIVLVTAHSDPDLIDHAMVAGVMGYLIKPIDRKDLIPAIALASSRFGDLMALRKDVQSLKEALVLRQQVERAKGILERRLGLSEEEAHKRLQHLARHERCTLAEAAGRIVGADKFFADLEAQP